MRFIYQSSIILLMLFTFSNIGYSQNFGVGTDTPDAMFEVHGEAMISLGEYLILSSDDNTRNWGIRSDGQHLSIREPKDADKEYVRIQDDGNIYLKPNGITTMTLVGATQNVGIGTSIPAQKLEVDGIVRLEPETHSGSDINKLAMIDDFGDVRANDISTLAVNDAISYEISGRVVKPGAPSYFDLPGPIADHTVTTEFTIYTTCDVSANPIVVNFKRYGTNTHSFIYKVGGGAFSQSNSNSVYIPFDFGCGAKTLGVTLNTATNTLTITTSGTGTTGLYIHSGRTTFFRWN